MYVVGSDETKKWDSTFVFYINRCSLTWWEKSGRGKWRTAKRRMGRRKVKVWPRELERDAVFYSGKSQQDSCFCTYTFLRLLHWFCPHTWPWLSVPGRQDIDRVSGSSKVALLTPFIALTFYVLTLQIICVFSLNLTTLQTVINGWCFNLGLSLTGNPEMFQKLFIVKFDVYNIFR